ncbi:hypothetical protein DICSQDRAFT_62836 [Dichomitus squalens LYAD-421 SS1]|uniref:Amidohydrolase-related domain-containing protein n=1 Tax=Dichomitus squalens (strain LYAD-421) TaxID=732165 RepID=R7SW07_DICSQ|nr:uncharacterized protein DICSQDRAFT_62836 [Dichomitus squalens LYAD-421 SS1]EJF60384.1 hypothetical protein DICSQDRAFT_62836 [Dichomitus squalens LYAD-421 SS1]
MSTDVLPPTPKSPGVGARRKGNKQHPTLPLSAFTPPNTGTSERFPIAPSPSTLQPEDIIDAHVINASGDLSLWKSETGQTIGGRVRGIVLSLHGAQESDIEKLVQDVASAPSSTPILAIAVPFKLEDGAPTSPPSYLAVGGSSKPTIVLTSAFTKPSPAAIEALAWALTQNFVVNIDVQSDLHQDGGWEALEDLLTKATASSELKGRIILSNILPPPDDLTLPIVKLLTHHTYRSYQSHTASLSLFANLYVNFLPPAWGEPTPKTPAPPASEKNEWKRRIKMYIGHAIEAFGFQRILFGSSPAALLSGSSPATNAGDWFELARESFAELGIEQDAIDAVFGQNARLVYAAHGESS